MAGKEKPKEKEKSPDHSSSIRKAAEDKLAKFSQLPSDFSKKSTIEIIHELQLHQMELEMQTEELKKSQLAFQESLNKYLDLYEFAPVGYLTITKNGIITDLNLTASVLLGVERNRIINKGFGQFVRPQNIPDWEQFLVGVRKSNEKKNCELELIRKDSSVFFVRLEGNLLPQIEGKPVIRIVLSDITREYNAGIALKKSEEMFRTLFENAPVLIDGFDKNGLCAFWNKECEKVFGWSIEEINSHDEPLALFYPDPDIRRQVIETVISTPESVFKEWHPLNRKGKELDVLWANFKLPDGLIINIGYDITDRKFIDDALIEANNKLNLLSSITRHDIMNKVITIIGFIQFARKKENLDEVKPFLDKIYESAKAIEHQITFTKDYHNLGVIKPQWLNFSTMIALAGEDVAQMSTDAIFL